MPALCHAVFFFFLADVILRTLGEGTFGKVVCCKDR